MRKNFNDQVTVSDLATICVLFRAPDTLTLYGIPYDMKPGQQPGDIWRGRRLQDPAAPHYVLGATVSVPGPASDWIWLGQPGWWSNLTREEQRAISEWLEKLGDVVPVNPYEWTTLGKLSGEFVPSA